MSSALSFTQVYCINNNQVLLMHRNKEPNINMWIAPGGKIELGESPREGAIRELWEETSLFANIIGLRGIVTILYPFPYHPCIHYLFLVTSFIGEIIPDEREGYLTWFPIEMVDKLSMPPASSKFVPRFLRRSNSFFRGKYTYDDARNIVSAKEVNKRKSSESFLELQATLF